MLVFTSCFTVIYRSCGAGLLYHVRFQEVYTCRRKEVESKHHGAAKESTLEQQEFDRTKITFFLRKNGGYICSSLGGRFVLVVRQAGKRKSYCLRNFQNFVTWLLMRIFRSTIILNDIVAILSWALCNALVELKYNLKLMHDLRQLG